MVHLRRDCHTALHIRKYRPGTEKNRPGNESVYIDAFYRPSVAFYGDIYGKILPKFDEENFEEAIKTGKRNYSSDRQYRQRYRKRRLHPCTGKSIQSMAQNTESRTATDLEKDTALFLRKES